METTKGFVFEPTTHSYYFDGKPMTGVTTILGVIAKPALIPWAANQVVDYIKYHVPVSDTGLYVVSEQVLGEARVAHRKKKEDAAEKGTDLHALVEEYVSECISSWEGRAFQERPMEANRFASIEPFIQWARSNNIRFIASEKKLYSKELWAAGTCDLVFEKDGKRYIGDIKTYAKIWDRVPFFQCAGYSLMWEEMNADTIYSPQQAALYAAALGSKEEGEWLARKEAKKAAPKVDGYCVLRLGKDGSFEELWSYDVEGDRKAFLAAVELYRALQNYKRAN